MNSKKDNTYFGFIDEVGLSVGDASQPFMAIANNRFTSWFCSF